MQYASRGGVEMDAKQCESENEMGWQCNNEAVTPGDYCAEHAHEAVAL